MAGTCNICKLILTSVYCALFIHFLRTLTFDETVLEINYALSSPGIMRRMEQKSRKGKLNMSLKALQFKRPERLPTDLKYVIKWTVAYSHYSSSVFKNGQEAFLDSNCSYYNCFMTNDKQLLPDLRHYDAILFDVENDWDDPPFVRSPHQMYIFTASESADNYPICEPGADDFYNLTWTYRLDSDLKWTYVTLSDKNNNIIGPRINMNWIEDMKPIDNELKSKLKNKKKAAAWFVSNCYAKNKREKVAEELKTELKKYNLTIDIYGWCGKLTCPRDRIENCLDLLEKDYYFYLAFENSMSEDYVTEKILYPLHHYTVPIVFGGADYSRFLPPGSYIDIRLLNVTTTAAIMHEAITNKIRYYDYFRWHNHYKYLQSPPVADICNLCKLLNEGTRRSKTVGDFRKWWNPYFRTECTGANRTTIDSFEKFLF